METTVCLNFIKQIPSAEFLKAADPKLSPQSVEGYSQELGKTFYEFLVTDADEKRTIVKTEKEVISFLDWYNKTYKESITLADLVYLKPFDHITEIADPKHHKPSSEFMEM